MGGAVAVLVLVAAWEQVSLRLRPAPGRSQASA